jgi:hypothetical protein
MQTLEMSFYVSYIRATVFDEVAEVIAKLREIEQQAFNTFLEVPPNTIAYSRLRHISTVAKRARMKLEEIKVRVVESLPSESDGVSKPADKSGL